MGVTFAEYVRDIVGGYWGATGPTPRSRGFVEVEPYDDAPFAEHRFVRELG